MMKNIQFFLFLALATFFAACAKEQTDDQAVPNYSDFTPTTFDKQQGGHDCGGGDQGASSASALVANFEVVLDNGTVSEQEALIITNKSVDAISYEWDFGNGDKATTANPSYEYGIHGNYTIKLTATDAIGNRQTATKDLTVLCIFGGSSHDE